MGSVEPPVRQVCRHRDRHEHPEPWCWTRHDDAVPAWRAPKEAHLRRDDGGFREARTGRQACGTSRPTDEDLAAPRPPFRYARDAIVLRPPPRRRAMTDIGETAVQA